MDAATQRMLELKGEERSNSEIAEILTLEGFKGSDGEPFNVNSVRSRIYRAAHKGKAKESDVSDKSERSEVPDLLDRGESDRISETPEVSEDTDESQLSEVAELSEEIQSTPSDKSALSEELRSQLIQIVQTEIRSIMEAQTVQISQTEEQELAPSPPARIELEEKSKAGKTVKVLPGKRVKIAGTVDKELHRLFQEWRQQKRISLSHALDTALWNFLGKPRLSFERED